jgi:predicted PurR-regulated permease PerM
MSLLALAAFALLVVVELPLWKPLLLAAVLAGSFSGLNDRLAARLGARRTLASALTTLGLVLVGVVPLGIFGYLVVREAMALVAFIRRKLAEQGVEALIAPLPDWLERRVGQAIVRWTHERQEVVAALRSRLEWALGVAANLLGSLTQLVITLAIMLVATFFLLRDGHALVDWCEKRSPLPPGQLRSLLNELRRVSKSVIGAHFATGFIQAAAATIGYTAAHVPSPLFFGVLTLVASFIPSVGTLIVGIPLSGLLWVMGRGGWALFLLLWSTLVTGMVDNLTRPLLVRGGTDLHGALILFSLLGGVLAFGPIGLVLGPLALALFLAVTSLA